MNRRLSRVSGVRLRSACGGWRARTPPPPPAPEPPSRLRCRGQPQGQTRLSTRLRLALADAKVLLEMRERVDQVVEVRPRIPRAAGSYVPAFVERRLPAARMCALDTYAIASTWFAGRWRASLARVASDIHSCDLGSRRAIVEGRRCCARGDPIGHTVTDPARSSPSTRPRALGRRYGASRNTEQRRNGESARGSPRMGSPSPPRDPIQPRGREPPCRRLRCKRSNNTVSSRGS